jgi:hypothetical protein
MKIMEFTYTKTNGTESQRSVMITNQPTDYVEGIDLTELDVETQVDFAEEYNLIYDQFRQQQLNLMSKYDVEHNYRKFIPGSMTDVKVEYV